MLDMCDSCGYKTEVKEYPVFPLSHLGRCGKITKVLCHLCASTIAGNAYENPDMYDASYLAGIICYIGNTLLTGRQ